MHNFAYMHINIFIVIISQATDAKIAQMLIKAWNLAQKYFRL